MKESDNIEKLFQEKFEHFEADVNPQVWTNVQHGINAGAGSAASAGAKFTIGKIIAGIVSVAVISGSIWYFSSSEEKTAAVTPNKPVETKEVTAKEEVAQNTVSEDHQPASNNVTNEYAGTSMPPAIRSLNHYGSDYSAQPENNSSGKNETSNIGSENTEEAAPQAEHHKYGPASKGTGGIIREDDKPVKSGSKTNKKNSSDSNLEYDQIPAVSISASTESGDCPLTVNFSNLGVSSALSWDFDDGTFSRETAPEHKFTKPGVYTVKLVAQNSKGSNTDKVTIEVLATSGINNPTNIITPNGDGVNDQMDFGLKNIASIEVTIFNIAGVVVHKSTSIDDHWDGKLANGSDAPDGVYYYTVQAIGTDGVEHPLRGDVTLSRKR